MSLLLKALKQAEAANTDKSGSPAAGSRAISSWSPWLYAGHGPGSRMGGTARPAVRQQRAQPQATPRRAFRWPRLSLVPLTALLAALVALGYGIYLYFALQPPTAVEPAA